MNDGQIIVQRQGMYQATVYFLPFHSIIASTSFYLDGAHVFVTSTLNRASFVGYLLVGKASTFNFVPEKRQVVSYLRAASPGKFF